jgi:hypothetical protein
MKRCGIENCENKLAWKGMCQMHYDKMRRHGDPHFIPKKSRIEKKLPLCKRQFIPIEVLKRYFLQQGILTL